MDTLCGPKNEKTNTVPLLFQMAPIPKDTEYTLLKLPIYTIILGLHNRIGGWVCITVLISRGPKAMKTAEGWSAAKPRLLSSADHLPALAILKAAIMNF